MVDSAPLVDDLGARLPTSLQNRFRLQEITGTEWVPRTYELRYRVWAREKQLPEAIEKLGVIRDDHDDHARHWGAFSDGSNLVASARLCIHEKQEDLPDGDYYDFSGLRLPTPVASLNRLVVLHSARGFGLARSLDVCRIDFADTRSPADVNLLVPYGEK